jgi:hypothetical protein
MEKRIIEGKGSDRFHVSGYLILIFEKVYIWVYMGEKEWEAYEERFNSLHLSRRPYERRDS